MEEISDGRGKEEEQQMKGIRDGSQKKNRMVKKEEGGGIAFYPRGHFLGKVPEDDNADNNDDDDDSGLQQQQHGV
jgi:hypothetical protein